MWTPRRVLLLILGVGLFGFGYGIYAYWLGGVDGLPALPSEFASEATGSSDDPLPPSTPLTPADAKLKIAFGEGCPECSYTNRIDIRSNGLVIAAGDFLIEPDGRVKLSPFSIAVFGKSRGPTDLPDITTVHCDIAYLEFDEPVRRMADMGSRKIVAAEFVSDKNVTDPDGREDPRKGRIHLTNHRKTPPPETDDDLYIRTVGPLMFRQPLQANEEKPNIWTASLVEVFDRQNAPKPASEDDPVLPTAMARGMNVYLQVSSPPPGADGKPRAVSITGARRVDMLSAVEINLWVDANSHFLSSSSPPLDKPATRANPPVKSRVQVRTLGPFRYDVVSDKARFEIVPQPDIHIPNAVEVRRHVRENANDILTCDYLELQFRRKGGSAPGSPSPSKPNVPPPASPANAADTPNLEIVSAHAWGKHVALSSDSEELVAYGNDLTYDAIQQQTVLAGEPEMIAMKDGNDIHAKRLTLSSINDKLKQQAEVFGPGQIRLLDKSTGQRTLVASWNDLLTFRKEGPLDLLVLTGGASFEDQAHGQTLRAKSIQLWLAEADTKNKPKSGANNDPARRPARLLAQGQVTAFSPDLIVRKSDHLNILFRDAEPTPVAIPLLPANTTTAAPQPVWTPSAQPSPAAVTLASPPAIQSGSTGSPNEPPKSPNEPRRPIELTARSVETRIIRTGTKNDLDEAYCVGGVQVHQDAGPGETRGVDVTGQAIRLKRYPEGNVIDITGTPEQFGELHLPRLSLLGPDIHVDQRNNLARVRGNGSMRLPSATDLASGEKLDRPTELVVHWLRSMEFSGNYAIFEGGVQAEQGISRLLCQNMQAFLDRVVSLNHTKADAKGQPPAQVEKVVCHNDGVPNSPPVSVVEAVRENGKLTKYQRILANSLAMDRGEGRVEAPGPGEVRIMQKGERDSFNTASPSAKSPPSGQNKPKVEEMKLTRVKFQGKMLANNKRRTATFFDNVEVTHVPSDDPERSFPTEKLPPGGLFLRCERLDVFTRKDKEGKTHQELTATNKASVNTEEFQGEADTIKFDEEKDLVTFEGTPGNLATLYRMRGQGGRPEAVRGTKIWYWRKTNEFKVDGGQGISSNP